jgi:HrpA-like RNA helicase
MPQGDILVFMTGQEDIEATCNVINGKLFRTFWKRSADSQNDSNSSRIHHH